MPSNHQPKRIITDHSRDQRPRKRHDWHGLLRCRRSRFLYTLPRNTDHALWTTAPLRRGIPHPSSYQALRLQTIQGRIEGSDRASALGCAFYLLPDCSAVSVFTQPRGRAQQQVFELAEHDYHHIVILIAIGVKLGMPYPVRWLP